MPVEETAIIKKLKRTFVLPTVNIQELNARENVKVHFYRELTNRCCEVKQPIKFHIHYRNRGRSLLAIADSGAPFSYVSRACFHRDELRQSRVPNDPILTRVSSPSFRINDIHQSRHSSENS